MIVGKGSIQLLMQNGEIKNIKDVRYVPGFNKNLLSIGQITDSGNLVLFTKSMCLVLTARKPYQTIAVGRRHYRARLYKLSTLVKNLEVHSAEILLLPSALDTLEKFKACTNISSLPVAPLPRLDPKPQERKLAKLWHA